MAVHMAVYNGRVHIYSNEAEEELTKTFMMVVN